MMHAFAKVSKQKYETLTALLRRPPMKRVCRRSAAAHVHGFSAESDCWWGKQDCRR